MCEFGRRLSRQRSPKARKEINRVLMSVFWGSWYSRRVKLPLCKVIQLPMKTPPLNSYGKPCQICVPGRRSAYEFDPSCIWRETSFTLKGKITTSKSYFSAASGNGSEEGKITFLCVSESPPIHFSKQHFADNGPQRKCLSLG